MGKGQINGLMKQNRGSRNRVILVQFIDFWQREPKPFNGERKLFSKTWC